VLAVVKRLVSLATAATRVAFVSSNVYSPSLASVRPEPTVAPLLAVICVIVRVTSGVKKVRIILPLVSVIAVFCVFRGTVSMTVADEFEKPSNAFADTAPIFAGVMASLPPVEWLDA
jgi:hypothetical protein